MRIHVLINQNAGRADVESIKESLKKALFRCELSIDVPKNILSLQNSVKQAIDDQVEVLTICGGDGTINCTLKPLMQARAEGQQVPKIAVLRSGTANDLATEMSVSLKNDLAARTILSDKTATIDLIEVTAGEEKRYMITNGGIGLPARVAQDSNLVREWLLRQSRNEQHFIKKEIASYLLRYVRSKREGIYKASMLLNLIKKKSTQWSIRVQDDSRDFITDAPYILISNQSRIGGDFVSAPYTANDDGFFNVVVLRPENKIRELRSLGRILRGEALYDKITKIFETNRLLLTACGEEKITFFGDGEILFDQVSEISLRCLTPGLEFIVPRQRRG